MKLLLTALLRHSTVLTTHIRYVCSQLCIEVANRLLTDHVQGNIAIHILCVPIIFYCILQHLTLPIFDLPFSLPFHYPFQSIFPPDASTAAAVLYSILYILMEPTAGTFVATIIMWTSYLAHLTTATYGATSAAKATGIIEAVAWIAQFIGHGRFEGRAPALLDNIVQSLFLAPFFVWLEVLFMLGYKPQLKRRIDRAVARSVAVARRKKMENSKGKNS